jgi:hypothetical protein
MKYLLLNLFLVQILCFSSQSDVKMYSKSGQILSLFIGLYYNITNKESGRMLITNNQIDDQNFNIKEGSNWWRFDKYDNSPNECIFSTYYRSYGKFFIENDENNYYYIISVGKYSCFYE